jgi:hypothetical protein
MSFHLERLIAEGSPERSAMGGSNLHEAINYANRLVEAQRITRAQIFNDPSNRMSGGSGTLEAVYSEATGWVELNEDPRLFWSGLSAETRTLLEQDPAIVLNEELRREVNVAGASLSPFFWEKTEENGEDVYRLPGNYQAFVRSLLGWSGTPSA